MDRRGDKDMIARPTGHGAMAVTLGDVSESLGSFMGVDKGQLVPPHADHGDNRGSDRREDGLLP